MARTIIIISSSSSIMSMRMRSVLQLVQDLSLAIQTNDGPRAEHCWYGNLAAIVILHNPREPYHVDGLQRSCL
jgi:hypothetical protein